MVHLKHSATHWRVRCVVDSSSEDENTPPNVASGSAASRDGNSRSGNVSKAYDDDASTGTATPPWLPPGTSKLGLSKPETNPPPSSPAKRRSPRSPTTSSPVLLETPPRSPLVPTSRSQAARSRQDRRQSRRAGTAPYSRPRVATRRAAAEYAVADHQEPAIALALPDEVRRPSRASVPDDVFALARWPYQVAHLREQYNPLATVFPSVAHFGWCTCSSPCRTDTCRNGKMNLHCNVNCCPYEGKCGNGIEESDLVCLVRNMRTSSLAVVAAGDIGAGQVVGQYLGEMEHVRASARDRPRNRGYRLIMKTRPELLSNPVRVAINAERMGGMMRFVNHSSEPVAEFREVANGRRTTVVVATTDHVRRGEEITVDYGDDLWFICRCGADTCRHRDIQDQRDP
ncbi:unnamed protein product [Phytophthora fragariaefolia]|uniref:Unnamed protein product n=1 Tax=Phytophthora fragariaefolia TaxID=1490495 RepID=A0A9W6TJD4_9STRA|nr:unnamed protein product [Phytophthora fragariaefolia]